MRQPRNVLVVAGGLPGHDFEYAKDQLLRLLHEAGTPLINVRTDFSDIEALEQADDLISYTCNVRPNDEAQLKLEQFLGSGHRWLALHATNALFDVTSDGGLCVTAESLDYLTLLGTRFIDHPPICQFELHIATGAEDHELLRDFASFTTADEFYVLDRTADIKVLLEATLTNDTRTSIASDSAAASTDFVAQPALYIRDYGRGGILYCTLGHCNSAGDTQAEARCSWESTEYRDILRHGLRWLQESGVETTAADNPT